MLPPHTNELINETSPYLLQHAHNPVNWVAWSNAAFEKAKNEDKMILISIGYSACHWCHVMEKESFEDEDVATWMNRYFVCIKVDREERPDVDQVYMTAVQLMTQKGGWPLNCFTLPDGKPIYGGTYFPKEQWIQVLKSLEHAYRGKKSEVEEYASRLSQGVQESEWIKFSEPLKPFEKSKIEELILRWTHNFDNREGGSNRAPKFPLPNNYEFLLRYAHTFQDVKVQQHVLLTLDKMAFGGIYDHLAGGFSRYSVDVLWKVPHFEKMLYDNAQLVSLYAKAYQATKNETYKNVVIQTLNWVENEMSTKEGAFYSALDADSEGVEGKFYVWNIQEIKSLLATDFLWVKEFYNLNQIGYWEEGNYILLKKMHDAEFCKIHQVEINKIETINRLLLEVRNKRTRPSLDVKCLTSWNAMQLKAYIDAYVSLGDETYLLAALKNAKWIKTKQIKSDFTLFHNFVNGESKIDGFLEDYAHTIFAFIRLYEVTFDLEWLELAKTICDKCIELFQDSESKMFYFTDNNSDLIARKMDINDNVIPSSNSVMCLNLNLLARFYSNDAYLKISEQMLMNVYEGMENYGSGYSNWAMVLLNFLTDFQEIGIFGENYKNNNALIQKEYLPNAIFYGGFSEKLEITKGKVNKTDKFYLCNYGTCSQVEENVMEFVTKIKKK